MGVRLLDLLAQPGGDGHRWGRANQSAQAPKGSSRFPSGPLCCFYDDTAGTTGKVIVGYIGPHLSNTRTN